METRGLLHSSGITTYAHTNRIQYTNKNAHTYLNLYGHTHTNQYNHPISYTLADADKDGYPNTDSFPHAYSNQYNHTFTNALAHSDKDNHAHTNKYPIQSSYSNLGNPGWLLCYPDSLGYACYPYNHINKATSGYTNRTISNDNILVVTGVYNPYTNNHTNRLLVLNFHKW
jgi:hypothetical protein